MGIYTITHLEHGGAIVEVEKMIRETFFASYFLHKDKIHLTHHRSSKYDAGQEIRIGTPEYSDVSKTKVPNFSASKCGTNSGRYGGRRVLQCQPPPDARGRKALQAENRYDVNNVTLKGLGGDLLSI